MDQHSVASGANADIALAAKPAAVTMRPSSTAVVVVDMQNDFGSDTGMFARAGIDISDIRRVVPAIAETLDSARKAGLTVVYLKMAYKPDLSDLGPPGSANHDRHLQMGVGMNVTAPDGRPSRILIRDTWNTDIIPELAPRAGDIIICKTRFSGFYGTDLHEKLQERGIKDLIFTGCTTSVCVESTVRDAMFRDYRCVLLADCLSEPIGSGAPRSNHEATLTVLEAVFGWVTDSASLRDALHRS